MKRQLLICGGGLTLFLVAALGVSQVPKTTSSEPPDPASLPAEVPEWLDDLKPVLHLEEKSQPAGPPAKTAPPKNDLVGQLIDILDRTESFDTFFVTVQLLADIGAEAIPAIPVILRNAERLGIFKNHCQYPKVGRDGTIVQEVHEQLKSIRRSSTVEQRHCIPAISPACG